MPSRAQGLLKPLSISPSSFLPPLAGGVIACCSRRPREGKCVSLNCLWACRWGISDHQCVFHWNELCNWVCEVLAHESWQPPNLDATVGQRGERYIFYIISLEPGPGAGHTKEHSLGRLAYYPQKRGVKERGCQCEKSEKERIPNLPKSSANPVSPCSLILSILNSRSRRMMDTAREALGRRKEILLCPKKLFWVKSSNERQQLNDGQLLS